MLVGTWQECLLDRTAFGYVGMCPHDMWSGLMFVFWVDQELPLTRVSIQSGEDFETMYRIDALVDLRDGLIILHGYIFYFPEIGTKPEESIFLWYG